MNDWYRIEVEDFKEERDAMVENDRILAERLNRILMSIALEKPDRVPVVLEYSGFAAYVTGTQMVDFLASPTKKLETMIQAYHCVGGCSRSPCSCRCG